MIEPDTFKEPVIPVSPATNNFKLSAVPNDDAPIDKTPPVVNLYTSELLVKNLNPKSS